MAQFGPHRFDAGDFTSEHTDEFTGATFEVRDLTGARFVDCDLSNVKIVDAVLADVDISGWVQALVVNGVDVTYYVATELDRRHPERVQLRQARTAEDFRALWQRLEQLWDGLAERGARRPDERVGGEWSFAETLRHLVFITDAWISRTVRDEERPFHPLALPQTAYPPRQARELGMDLDATPTLAEVLEARRTRQQVVRSVLAQLGDADLGRETTRPPAPGYPDQPWPVWECLAITMEEESEHYRFALRDLDAAERTESEQQPAQ